MAEDEQGKVDSFDEAPSFEDAPSFDDAPSFEDAPSFDDLDAPFHDDAAPPPADLAASAFELGSLPAAAPVAAKIGPTMPADPDSERALLSSIFIDPDALMHAMGRVRGEDFWDRRHGLIFDAMQLLARESKPTDPVAVHAELLRQGKAEQAGGLRYLASLSEFAGSAASAAHYALQVQRLATVRSVIKASAKIQAAAYENSGDPDAVIATAQSEMNRALEGSFGAEAAHISSVVGPVYERVLAAREHEGEVTGIPTGYRDLDKLLLGIHRTDLVILAARPAMGKTSFALNLGLNIARTQVPLGRRAGEAGTVLIFSLEMGRDQLVQRLLSQRARIGLSELRKGNISDDDEVALRKAASDLSDLKIFIDDQPALSTVDLAARAKRVAMQHGIDLIVVDYLQLMRGTGGSKQSREQEISEISRTLKGLAKELDCTVLALSQLNRSLESRADKRPMMSDLRESGAIEQDADIILFVYRDWVYHPETAPENLAELIIAKHRAGPTGKVEMHFEGKFTRFSNLDDRFGDAYAGVPRPNFG